MGRSFLYLLTLLAVLQLSSVRTRYFLIELEKEQVYLFVFQFQLLINFVIQCYRQLLNFIHRMKFVFDFQETQVSEGSDRSRAPSKKTFTCETESEIDTLGNGGSVISCSKDEDDFRKGNYILYEVKTEGNQDILELTSINAEICEPKPKKCHCKTMLDKLLKRYENVDRIDGIFFGNSFIQTCRCFLGSAAYFGFQFVEFSAKSCPGKTEFSKTNYRSICDTMEKRRIECENMAYKSVKVTRT